MFNAKQLAEAQDRIKQLEADNEKLKADLAQCQRDLETAKADSGAEQLKADLEAAQSQADHLKGELSKAQADLEAANTAKGEAETKAADLEGQLSKAKKETADLLAQHGQPGALEPPEGDAGGDDKDLKALWAEYDKIPAGSPERTKFFRTKIKPAMANS